MMGMLSNGLSMTGYWGGIMSEDESGPKDDSSSLQDKLSRIFGHGQEKLRENVKDWNARKTLDAVLDLSLIHI